jgi:hypothetical protein
MARACLVSGREAGLDAAGADRLRDTGLPAFRTFERVAAFGFDLGLVIESSEVCATPSAAPPQPRPAKSQPAGQDPGSGCSRPSPHSNAPFGLECQSILSKIVAAWVSQNGGSTIRWFDPFRPSHPFRRLARPPKRRENGPEIPAFRIRFCLQTPNPGRPIAKSLQPRPRKFPFCRDGRQRLLRSRLAPRAWETGDDFCLATMILLEIQRSHAGTHRRRRGQSVGSASHNPARSGKPWKPSRK